MNKIPNHYENDQDKVFLNTDDKFNLGITKSGPQLKDLSLCYSPI